MRSSLICMLCLVMGWSNTNPSAVLGQTGESKTQRAAPKQTGAPPRLELPGKSWTIDGHRAFVFLPEESKRSQPQPWIFYAPTLPAYPDEAERWMHEQFLTAGVAVAGVNVGEAYGNPSSHQVFLKLYEILIREHGFAPKACCFGRSRGGLWVSSWAIAHPEKVSGIIGIYPVFDFRTYPKLDKAAPAYGLTSDELVSQNEKLNPISRINVLAKSKIPIVLIHGDEDKVVPLDENSAELKRRYEKAGASDLVELIVAPGQGHSFWEGFFREQRLVDFAIENAKKAAAR
ncbi:Prolyl oligopeptidase family protein [Pirellula sp. SH-Sr6A]|uniref:alpha/beta hydrolase family protein n=1 Tax=Pirellula sp. SH-Sr6A TaxID=1632865 RepID=UPI00078B38DF|nr:prolyl oligopeptidase family serine peptidase [Pirellula sp. SH-Sr6A]AMV33822.1 Prolyl oligopeptidase family protein [Pirellula sp. SH-Sr6A]